MPQSRIDFYGTTLDPKLPLILQNHGHITPQQYGDFVRDINTAISQTQHRMGWSPYAMLCLMCTGMALVIVDVALSSSDVSMIQTTHHWGLVVLTVCVFVGMAMVCYVNTCRPRGNLEQQVEQVCEAYSSEEKNLHFFYRHNAAVVGLDENRFYIEVFVPDDHVGDDDEDDEGQQQQKSNSPKRGVGRKKSRLHSTRSSKDLYSVQQQHHQDDNNDYEESMSSVSYNQSQFPLLDQSAAAAAAPVFVNRTSPKRQQQQRQQQQQQQQQQRRQSKTKAKRINSNSRNNNSQSATNNNASTNALVNLTPEQLMELGVGKTTTSSSNDTGNNHRIV